MEITGSAWFVRFRRYVNALSGWFEWVGLIALVSMVLAAIIDVVGSKGLEWPLPGSTEITGVLQVMAIAGGLAFSKIDGRHIRVGFLLDSLTGRRKAAFEVFISILGLGLFAVAALMTCKYGLRLLNSGTETFLLGIPLYPFSLWISLCCIIMCFVILIELLNFIGKVLR